MVVTNWNRVKVGYDHMSIRVVVRSISFQIALPEKWAPRYKLLGCLLATGALYLDYNSQVNKNETEKKPHLCSHLHNL